MTRSVPRRAAARLLAVACMALTIGGCGPAGGLHPVKGRVLVDGEPLTGASGGVAFIPNAAKGNNSPQEPHGTLNAQGEFELTTGTQPGAAPGWYKVVVTAQEPVSHTDPYAKPKYLVADEYTKAETTPLEVEVVAKPGSGAYDLNVKKAAPAKKK